MLIGENVTENNADEDWQQCNGNEEAYTTINSKEHLQPAFCSKCANKR